MRTFSLLWTSIAWGASLLLLSGCATFSEDHGFSTVQSLIQNRIGKEVKWIKSDADAAIVRSIIQPLLAKPLSVEGAITITLLNNQRLQALYSELGIAEANLVQVGQLPNPSFTFGRLKRGNELEVDRALMLPIMSILLMPMAARLEQQRFEQTQLHVADEVLKIADETRRAYINAVAAQEIVTYMDKVKTAAEASAELARTMAAVGNWSALRSAREQSFYADAVAQYAQAHQKQVIEQEHLTRLMGLWGAQTAFQLPERLADLPKAPRNISDIEAQAMQNRLDIMIAKRELAGLAYSLGVTKTTRFINILNIGAAHNSYTQVPQHENGYEIELQIPLFDWGGAKVTKAEAMYMQALHHTSEIAIKARSEARAAYSGYKNSYDVAKHYRDEVVPLKKRISDEQLRRYNGMLISVFDLLADARAQVMSVNASIEALRSYWIADANLNRVLMGSSSSSAEESTMNANPSPQEIVAH